MGRYSKDIQLEQPIDVVSMVMEDFIYHNRFSRTDWNGEMVYYLKDRHKRERYMKWVYVDGRFHVEAWLKNAMGGEMDLDGLGGGASRREFRAGIDGLIETLKKTAAGSLAGGHIGSDPLHHDSGHADNHTVWKEDTKWQQNSSAQPAGDMRSDDTRMLSGTYQTPARPADRRSQNTPDVNPAGSGTNAANTAGGNTARPFRDPEANAALIFAILALMFGWSFPILGIIFLILARRKTDYSANPGAVKILCILAIVGIVLGFCFHFMIGIVTNLFF